MKGAESSEDELAPLGIHTSRAYELLSDLSDEDYGSANEGPSSLESQPPTKATQPLRSVEIAVRNAKGRLQQSGSSSSSSSSEMGAYINRTAGTTRQSTSDGGAQHDRHSTIEIVLPQISNARKRTFQSVEVSDWEDGYDGGGKKKRQRDEDEYSDANDSDDVEMEDSPPFSGPRRSLRRKPNSDMPTLRNMRSTAGSRFNSDNLDSGDDMDEPFGGGRQLRGVRQTRLSFPAVSRSQSQMDDEPDELVEAPDDSDKDGTFVMIQSDIAGQPKKRRRGPRPKAHFRDSSIEFEARHRRSSRSNKNKKRMVYATFDDDDDEFGYQEEKAPGAPKVVGVRETFKQCNIDAFIDVHRPVCEVCQGSNKALNKGGLIYCQGCSNSYHKGCLGLRSSRDHCVTKVSSDNFVLQCRFCVGNFGTAKKEVRPYGAPRGPQATNCNHCAAKGPSCQAFSTRKTPKQEEKLRADNDGIDPITPVAPELIDNPDNVLFRCCTCRRGFHYEHLPHPWKSRDPARDDMQNLRKHRLDEYSINWLCKECLEVKDFKPQTIVAWRPVNKERFNEKEMLLADLSENDIEYLIKWDNKSYRHCIWMPGAWTYGYVAGPMRTSFYRRNDSEFTDEADEAGRNALLKYTFEDAVPETYVTPDVILDIHAAPRSGADEVRYKRMSHAERREFDLSRIHHVTRFYVKFEGLGYEDAVWDEPPSPDNESIWSAFYTAYHEYLNGKHFQTEAPRTIADRIQDFRTLNFKEEIELKEQPAGLRRGKLMRYQLDGVNWILYNFRMAISVILADEMGLGKTVQVVAALSSLVQDNPKIWPFLIVVPNPTCANWRREIKKWAPDLRVVAYYGGRASQDLAFQNELFPHGTRHMKAHIVIMSYDSAQDDRTRRLFAQVKWAGLIVDEAQRLKNDQNLLYKALRAMRIPWSLLLTGTPLQNNKRELFNLLQFIDPKEIDAAAMDVEFADLDKERVQTLHEKIRLYFLRRTKAQVLTFLPPMAQIIVPVSMSVVQEKLCKSIMEKNPQLIRSIFARGKLKSTEKTGLNNILMQLRKCLCHPFIYSRAIEDVNTSVDAMRRNLIEASPKLLLLEKMLPVLKERGHRVLIFSQFLEQLTILEDFLNGMLIRYERLDGSLSSIEKQKRIDAFNEPESTIFCMLLSTRSGGVGINLATADTVIILDPDFNPHQDIQALSRAHRIGQKKKVLCFQMMTQDTPEEKMLQIGRKKMALDHVLIESMDDESENPADMEDILRHGAAALFSEDRLKDKIVYDKAAIEKLLDRSASEETNNGKDNSTEGAFAFARVWSNDGTLADEVEATEHALNVGVWDDILKEREEEARQEALRNMEVLGRGNRRRQAANYASVKYEFEEPEDGPEERDDKSTSADDDFKEGVSPEESSEEEEEGNEAGLLARLARGTKSKKSVAKQVTKPDARGMSKPVASQGAATTATAVTTVQPSPLLSNPPLSNLPLPTSLTETQTIKPMFPSQQPFTLDPPFQTQSQPGTANPNIASNPLGVSYYQRVNESTRSLLVPSPFPLRITIPQEHEHVRNAGALPLAPNEPLNNILSQQAMPMVLPSHRQSFGCPSKQSPTPHPSPTDTTKDSSTHI